MTAGETTPGQPRLSVLLLCDDDPAHASTLLEHIDALRRLSHHDVQTLNPRGIRRFRFLDLDRFDAVVVHYSLFLLSDHYVPRELREKLRRYEGLKVQFVQDDYRRVDAMCVAMREVGIDVLFTLVPERELTNVWTEERLPGVHKVTTLAGYVSDAAVRHATPALETRPLDVGYRGRSLPYWLGILGQEKAWIAQEFARRCRVADLRCDLGWRESDRIYGRSWFDFIASCKVTLGTESGSTITDFDGSLERRTDDYLRAHPEADFWEVHREILEPYEGNVRMNVVSPRIFEAIALRTGLVLFPGEYSGVIEPEKHYIPLEKDFSNFDDVAARIRDVDTLGAMVERAYRDVVAGGRYSYSRLVEQLDSILDARASRRAEGSVTAGVAEARVRQTVRRALEKPRGGALGRAVAGTTLVAEDAELRALAAAWARRAGRGVSARRLASDLVRLAVLRRAQTGRLAAGIPFAVEPELRNGEVLVLRSHERRAGEEGEGRNPVDASDLPVIVWDHSEVRVVAQPLTSWWWGRIRTGQRDLYEFQALQTLAEHDMKLVQRALGPVLSPPLPQEGIPAEPDPAPLPLRMLRYPGDFAPKGLLLLQVLSSGTPLRRVMAATIRARAPLNVILRDLLKLELLHRTVAGGLADSEGVAVETELTEEGLLTVTTRPSPTPAAAIEQVDATRVRKLVWDHSSLGSEIHLKQPKTAVALDSRGTHEFVGLETLMPSAAQDVAAAIDYALRPTGR